MKIINLGNYIPTTYRFHCTVCNCVYEADEWELQQSSEVTSQRHSYTHCPMCGNKIPTCYAEIVDSTDKIAETITKRETKSESAENHCEDCAYLGSSNFCVIPGKTPSAEPCDCYKSIKTHIIERAELTKLKVSVKFLQKYCENNHGCKDCPFSGSMDEGCRLAKTPELWNIDF